MEILKNISKDRLIIMVTHNPDLAEQYSSRIIRVLDGRITGDSHPLTQEEREAERAVWETRKQENRKAPPKPSMSFGTSFMLSLKNLFTKKGRTTLTAFAGSIGIIGIALILSLSTGIDEYIDQVQQDTLASYPITIEAETVDMSAMMTSLMGAHHGKDVEHDMEQVYSSNVMFDMMDSMFNAETSTNNLKAFKEYLDNGGGGITDLASIHYGYDFDFDIYTEDADGAIIKSDVITLMQEAMSAMYGGDYSAFFNSSMGSMYESFDVWEELLPGEDGALVGGQVLDQYDLIHGAWPQAYDEVVLFVDSHNEISDLMLYALGLISAQEMNDTLNAMLDGEKISAEQLSWTYEELCDTTFKLILPAEYYQHDAAAGTYVDMSATGAGMDYLYNSSDVGTTLKVVGIARPSEDATSGMVTGRHRLHLRPDRLCHRDHRSDGGGETADGRRRHRRIYRPALCHRRGGRAFRRRKAGRRHRIPVHPVRRRQGRRLYRRHEPGRRRLCAGHCGAADGRSDPGIHCGNDRSEIL